MLIIDSNINASNVITRENAVDQLQCWYEELRLGLKSPSKYLSNREWSQGVRHEHLVLDFQPQIKVRHQVLSKKTRLLQQGSRKKVWRLVGVQAQEARQRRILPLCKYVYEISSSQSR